MNHPTNFQSFDTHDTSFVNRWGSIALVVMAITGCASGASLSPNNDSRGSEEGSGSETDDDEEREDPPVDSVDPQLLALQTLNILTEYCSGCHAYPSNSGGLDYITDLGQLVTADYVTPGVAEDSYLYQRLAAGEMPPTESGPTDEEITIIRQWINLGAPALEQPETCENVTITYDEILANIASDLITIDLEDRPFTRYLSIHDVYNRQACDTDVAHARNVATKLVNSLSQNFNVSAPVPIDAEELILRVDLRDYGWESSPVAGIDLWEKVAEANPYALKFAGDNGETVRTLAATSFPVQTLSSFLQITSRPPLYYDFVGFPSQLEQFLDDVGVDLEQAQIDGDAIRAGSQESGVAFFGRLLERVSFALGRVLWISYDFDANIGDASIFADPLNAAHVGNEVIYSLPNGFSAYAITDAAGNRLDRAPINVVIDPLQRTQEVIAGISCMNCHQNGILPMQDQIRPYALLNPFKFLSDLEEITDLYVTPDVFQDAVDYDNQNLGAVHSFAGLSLDSPDGLVEASLNFERDLTLEDFAAEIGFDPEYIATNIAILDPELLVLFGGGRVPREVVDRVFTDSLCTFPAPDFKVDDEECFEPQ